jgi:hypothetical protein
MLKASLSLIVFVAVLAIPAAFGSGSKPGPKTVAQTLLKQMNSGPNGYITRRVRCTRVAKLQHSFSCDLRSTISTHLGAHIAVVDGGVSTTWKPLAG